MNERFNADFNAIFSPQNNPVYTVKTDGHVYRWSPAQGVYINIGPLNGTSLPDFVAKYEYQSGVIKK